MVFYFTGTGNSLYAARQLEDNPVSIPQVMREGTLTFQAETIGVVCPVYGHEVPAMVKEFLKKTSFQTDYFYMVLTYGNRHGGAVELARELCRSCGIEPAYMNVLLMADNWLPSFDMEEQKRLDKNVEGQLAAIREDVRARRRLIAPVTDSDRAAHQEFLSRMSQMPEDAWQHLLLVTEDCVGCGICERVCPSGSIHVTDGNAVHTPGKCQTCLACIHACPHRAIQLTVPEKNPEARYRNEHVTLEEIIRSNSRK